MAEATLHPISGKCMDECDECHLYTPGWWYLDTSYNGIDSKWFYCNCCAAKIEKKRDTQ